MNEPKVRLKLSEFYSGHQKKESLLNFQITQISLINWNVNPSRILPVGFLILSYSANSAKFFVPCRAHSFIDPRTFAGSKNHVQVANRRCSFYYNDKISQWTQLQSFRPHAYICIAENHPDLANISEAVCSGFSD